MSKAMHALLDSEAARSYRILGVEGTFPIDVAVLEGSLVVFLCPNFNTDFSFR
jgi:hypothetical protein